MEQFMEQARESVMALVDGLLAPVNLPATQIAAWQSVLSLILLVLLFVVAGGVVVLAVYGAKTLVRHLRIADLDRRYPGIARHIDKVYRIRGRRRSSTGDWFDVEFPVWLYGNIDGSRDLRRSNNTLVWDVCCLFLGHTRISCDDPRDMFALVEELRKRGANIPMHELEQDKAEQLLEKARAIQAMNSAQAIYRQFEEHPTDFEEYCAEIYRRLGYEATVTSRTNDGGYDIMLRDARETVLVECKCYESANQVGRPLLQKLYGANATVHAGRLVFITTSSFSREAIEYARTCGIPFGCVDGDRLVALHEKAYGTVRRRVGLDDVDWRLTWEDIRPHYPPDFDEG